MDYLLLTQTVGFRPEAHCSLPHQVTDDAKGVCGVGDVIAEPKPSSPASRAEADMARTAQARTEARQRDQDLNLRSCKAVLGYSIKASDGKIRHVRGLLVDEESWAIRYLVVSTSNWWPRSGSRA